MSHTKTVCVWFNKGKGAARMSELYALACSRRIRISPSTGATAAESCRCWRRPIGGRVHMVGMAGAPPDPRPDPMTAGWAADLHIPGHPLAAAHARGRTALLAVARSRWRQAPGGPAGRSRNLTSGFKGPRPKQRPRAPILASVSACSRGNRPKQTLPEFIQTRPSGFTHCHWHKGLLARATSRESRRRPNTRPMFSRAISSCRNRPSHQNGTIPAAIR